MADSFQPDSFAPDTIEPATAPQAKRDSFVADSFVADETANPASTPQVTPEAETPDMLSDDDFKKIGQKYGVSPEELKSIAPYYDARYAPKTFGEALEQGGKSAAGFAGRTVGLGVPQFAYKKLQEPNVRQAIDELRNIGQKQRSYLDVASEIVTPGGAIGAAAKSTAGRVIGAAATGGVIGTTESEEGKELESAAKGAAIGTALGGTAELIGKLARKYKPSKIDESLVDGQTTQRQFDINEGVKDIDRKTRDSEDLIEQIGFGKKEGLSKPELDLILEQQVGRDKLNKYLNPASEEGSLIRNKIRDRADGEVTETVVKRQLLDDILERRARDFAEDLTGKRPANYETAMQEIEELASRQGTEAISNRYKQFVEFQQAERHIEENGIRALGQPGFFGKATDFISDNQYVLRGIDEKFGSKAEDILRDLNKDFNRSTFAHTEFRKKFDDIFKLARKEGVDDTVVNSSRVYDALDTGTIKGLTPQEKAVADKFREYFNDIRGFVNGKVKEKDPRIAPLSIPFRENYVPKMIKQTPELVVVMEKKLAEATAELEARLGRKISDLAQLKGDEFSVALQSPAVKDLVDAVQLFDNKAVKDGAELSTRLKEMLYSREGNIALETQARAALERKGVIPDFMLEKNLYKLVRRYTDNTVKHLYLRNNIDKLRYQAQALKKAGADAESAYVKNIVGDLLGIRKGTAAEAMMQSRIKMLRSVDRMIDKYGKDSVAGGMLTGVKALPQMMEELTRQIYPNVLGYWNIRAVIQNSTQSITKTAPELGTKYGYATILRAAANVAGNMNRLTDKAQRMGTVPDEFIRAGERAIAEGIQRSSLYQVPKSALEGMGKMGMKAFQWMEKFNRALAVSTGEVMARDLARGSKLAQDSLKKFPTNIRKEILNNIQDSEKNSELIGKYLNDATQYNYNRASMSEFGRVMGPFFSTFSKWPTATVGDIVQEFRNKGAFKGSARAAEKYIAPFLLLQSIDFLMGERSDDKDSLSDRQKKLIGSGGLSQSAPIGALGGVLKGEIFTPPAADAFIQTVVNPILEGDSAKAEKGFGTTVMNFSPAAGLFRFIFDDVVTYISGNRPEGTNNLERSIEGAKEFGK